MVQTGPWQVAATASVVIDAFCLESETSLQNRHGVRRAAVRKIILAINRQVFVTRNFKASGVPREDNKPAGAFLPVQLKMHTTQRSLGQQKRWLSTQHQIHRTQSI